MTKRQEQTSGSSYSLLALLKRTLYLHETSPVDELVEEVREHMMKNMSHAELKERYIQPILKGNPSFREIEAGSQIWKLAEGNKVNDMAYEVFQKYHAPLSERQILNRIAKLEHITGNITLALNLKDDPRFADIDGGKYWFLSEWTVINDHARSVLLKAKAGLTEEELLDRVVEEHRVNRESAIFIPMIDDRFVKKEKRWILKRFVEQQKTKLRPSQIERLYQALQKSERGINIDELTTTVLNLPANLTDAAERLTNDPRFVCENDLWDLHDRIAAQPEPTVIEAIETPEIAPEPEQPEAAPEIVEQPPVEVKMEAPVEEQIAEPAPVVPLPEEAAEATEEKEEEVEETSRQMGEYMENLRVKVVDFLQDAFRTEGVVYNAHIIDQFVNADNKEELFDSFVFEHFVNPGKGRILTHPDVIKFMIYLAEPTLNDKIIDPCCGTGGFLLHILETLDDFLQDAEWTERDDAIQYELRSGQFYFVRMTEEEREYFPIPLEDEVARWLPIIRFCKQQQLTGVDIDRFAYRTADLNIAIQGFPEILLHQDNALTSKQIGSGMYDIVIGNPPAAEDNPTRFLRRSLTLAKPGGKILLLLPDEMFQEYRLVGSTLRNQMMTQTILKAVIRLPETDEPGLFGQRRTLLYCLRKHHDAEQESDVFIGEVADYEGLAELIDVFEYFEAPVSQSDAPIDAEIVQYVLSSYERSAYNLFIEGLRRGALQGKMVTVKEWAALKKEETAE